MRRAALYPINSLMTQGVMFANHGLPRRHGSYRRGHPVRSSPAARNCQELYLTPSLLDAGTWDALAEAAIWSRKNADVLVDTHWIGGDPAKGEVYGWASWSKRKGILALRNPKDQPGRISDRHREGLRAAGGSRPILLTQEPVEERRLKGSHHAVGRRGAHIRVGTFRCPSVRCNAAVVL